MALAKGLGKDCVPLGTPSIRRHNDAVLPLVYILHDPLQHRRLSVQVIHRDVKEALAQETHTHTHTKRYTQKSK